MKAEFTKEFFDKIVGAPETAECLSYIKADDENSLAELMELVTFEAPTGAETARACEMLRRFRELGLSETRIDKHGNVIGVRKGLGKGRILIEAHMDTVFPFGTVTQKPEIRDGIIKCPSADDNTRGLTVLLAVIRALDHAKIATNKDIIFAGTVREEGLGGLTGIKSVIEDMEEQPDASISVDGGAFQDIVYLATGIRALEYHFRGKSGHPLSVFGEASQCAHAMGRAIAHISEIEVPLAPKTIYTVTDVQGGERGIFSVPDHVSFSINIRSDSEEELTKLEKAMDECCKRACAEENARWGKNDVSFYKEVPLVIPAGSQEKDSFIVKALENVIEYLGGTPYYAKGGSCNANIPISKGIPAVCIGSSNVDQRQHTLDEFFITENSYKCPQSVALLALLLAQ